MSPPAADRHLDALGVATVAFVVANVLHGIDHQRQGTARLTTEVMAGGTVLTILAFVTLVMVLRRHPRAPMVAAAVGISAAIGVSAAHLAPHWSAFSDPYPALSVDAISWIVVLAEIASAAILGVVALREVRRRSVAAPGGIANPALRG